MRGDPPLGDVITLVDERGRELGSALWSARGPIAARIFDRGPRLLDEALITERLEAAASRRALLYDDASRDAFRLVHGEADRLPGLFIDRYADAAVIQTTTAAMDARKADIARILVEKGRGNVTRVICRDDGSARDLEELPRSGGVLIDRQARGTKVRFHDAGSLMEADLLTDRKTGSFLDQQENHATVGEYARRMVRDGKRTALDCFTYHGGFALSLGRAGLKVTACDEDAEAVRRARHNATLNGAAAANVDFVVANAFDLLRQLEAGGARFDVVVIDPPALAKRGRGRGNGLAARDSAWERAYKELNLRAARLVAADGLLATCSCSGRVSAGDFESIVDAAARDAGRTLQVLERRGAGRDHPALLGWPESEYLKCWLLRAIS